MQKTLVITGANGFIGHNLLSFWKNRKNYKIIALYHQTKPLIEGPNIESIKADLSRPSAWRNLRETRVHALIHCAAKIPKTFGGNEDQNAALINTQIDSQAIAFAENHADKFIYISSASIYDFISGKRIRENTSLKKTKGYLGTKIQSEKHIAENDKIKEYFIFRISAPYGPYQRIPTVISLFLRKALQGLPLQYYGNGSREQDFVFAADIALACQKALNNHKKGIYNIASGQSISMKDLALLIKKVTRSASPIESAQKTDVQEDYRPRYDITKAKNRLGWRPGVSLASGLKKYAAFIQEHAS